MRIIFIFCFTSLFLCIKCGLIKEILGTVSNEIHKVTDGNVIKNVVNMVHNETKEFVHDLGDLLHMTKDKNNENKKATEANGGNKQEGVSKDETKAETIQVSTIVTNKDEIVQPSLSNNQNTSILHPATEPIAKQGPESGSNKNQVIESTNTLEESSQSSKPEFIEEGYHYGEGTISPRFGRHIKMDNVAKDSEIQQEPQDVNVNEPNYSVDNENVIVDENSDPSLIYNFTNINDMININMPSENIDVEIVVVSDCPEGQEMALNGTCFDIETSTELRKEGKNRASFTGGCFYGFARADDGTCQEVIYD